MFSFPWIGTRFVASCAFVGVLAPLAAAAAEVHLIEVGPGLQRRAQEAMILARPGDIIEFGTGTFEFTATLSLEDVEGVTIRGKGMDETILDFSGLKAGTGGEGIFVIANNFLIEDLAIHDPVSDAIKVRGSDGVTFRRVRVRWTRGPHPDNGAYGLYPVLCKNVLIEDCEAFGASDSGVYVGQSSDIVVRGCLMAENVAGIEIENCTRADVYNNESHGNTGGILVFTVPGLKVNFGSHCRVFKNNIHDNNLENFGRSGSVLSMIPPGSGVIIMSTSDVEVFENEIRNHQTGNLAIMSYLSIGRRYDDPGYNPYTTGIHVHHNEFGRGGYKPKGLIGAYGAAANFVKLPEILWDGIVDLDKYNGPESEWPAGFSIHDNGSASFLNLNVRTLRTTGPATCTNLGEFEAVLEPLEPVQLEGRQ